MLTRTRHLAVALVAIGSLAWTAAPATAGITLTSSTLKGFGPYTSTVSGDPINNPPSYTITLIVPGGSFSDTSGNTINLSLINASQNYSLPVGPSSSGYIDDSSTSLSNSGPNTATVTFQVLYDSYGFPQSPRGISFTSTLGASRISGGASVTASEALIDDSGNPNNLIILNHGAVTSTAVGDTRSGSFLTGLNGATTPAPPYKILEQVTVTLPAYAAVTFDLSGTISAVPEPTTIVTAMTGLPIAVLYLRRRRRQSSL